MTRGTFAFALLGGAATLMLSSASGAAPVPATTDASGTTTVLKPLSILKRADLDFGAIVVAGAGTATIDPVSGNMALTGPLTRVGTGAQASQFTATGNRNSVVLIRIPQNPVTLTRAGGTETMTVSNWTLDGPVNRRIPPTQTFDFAVGGRLNVAAGQADGTYTGTFTVTVQYP